MIAAPCARASAARRTPASRTRRSSARPARCTSHRDRRGWRSSATARIRRERDEQHEISEHPECGPRQAGADERQNRRRHDESDDEVRALREHGRQRKHFARKVDLADEVRVADDALRRHRQRAGKERPRQRFGGPATRCSILRAASSAIVQRGRSGTSSRRRPRERHEQRPGEAHDRLRIAQREIAQHELITRSRASQTSATTSRPRFGDGRTQPVACRL